MALPLTEFGERLADSAEGGIFCTGVQASVAFRGQTQEVAFGTAGPDAPCRTDSIWRLFCAGKPLIAVAVAQCVQDGRISLDIPLAEQLDDDRLDGMRCTPRQLLDHTAGLHGLHGYGFGALPLAVRDEQSCALRPPPGWDPDRDAGYSEYAAWHLLGRLVEQATGETLPDHLREHVCGPYAAAEIWFAMRREEYLERYERIGVMYDMRGPEAVPMLANRAPRPCTELNAAYGGYGTARGLRTFYSTLLSVLHGEGAVPLRRETLSEFVDHRRGRRADRILPRSCNFALGFMVDFESHGFAPCVSERAFGHSGYMGAGFALADPESDLAVAIIWNGIPPKEIGLGARRDSALRWLYRDLGLPSVAELGAAGRGAP